MSMSENTEKFEQLQRLLKLKRYEQPPPRYFNDFSQQVIARIRAGERVGDVAVMERLWEAPWLQRIWSVFEAKPMLAGVLGVAVCGFLITGVVYSDKADVQPVALIPVSESAPSPAQAAEMMAANHPLLAHPSALEASSTSPVSAFQSEGLLFGDLRGAAKPATFSIPGKN
jgi:hypothetical protein